MFLDTFFNENQDHIWINQEQASQFAKEVCADFNPIHDPGAKRFCVPGNLLFALVLRKYGLSKKMSLKFLRMVSDTTKLYLPVSNSGAFTIKDQHGNALLEIERRGESTWNHELIETLIRCYGTFSGHNFPDILMPVLKKHGIMFNTKRPLILYDSMWFELQSFSVEDLKLELVRVDLENQGKRAIELVNFKFICADKHIGSGQKRVVLSGLNSYDEKQIKSFADNYNSRRHTYQQSIKPKGMEKNWYTKKGNSPSC